MYFNIQRFGAGNRCSSLTFAVRFAHLRRNRRLRESPVLDLVWGEAFILEFPEDVRLLRPRWAVLRSACAADLFLRPHSRRMARQSVRVHRHGVGALCLNSNLPTSARGRSFRFEFQSAKPTHESSPERILILKTSSGLHCQPKILVPASGKLNGGCERGQATSPARPLRDNVGQAPFPLSSCDGDRASP